LLLAPQHATGANSSSSYYYYYYWAYYCYYLSRTKSAHIIITNETNA